MRPHWRQAVRIRRHPAPSRQRVAREMRTSWFSSSCTDSGFRQTPAQTRVRTSLTDKRRIAAQPHRRRVRIRAARGDRRRMAVRQCQQDRLLRSDPGPCPTACRAAQAPLGRCRIASSDGLLSRPAKTALIGKLIDHDLPHKTNDVLIEYVQDMDQGCVEIRQLR
jgi:hypothetical protein